MLPGLKVLCATVLLAVAILTFALGSAALLRATHENFASLPTWKSPSDAAFAPPPDARENMPTLAMLRVEPADLEPDPPHDAMPAIPVQAEPLADPAIALPPPSSVPKEAAPRVVAALPAQIEDAPPVVALPALAALPRQPMRMGPLLMPEIATNEAPPVAYASLDPATLEPDAEPLEFAPLPRPRPSVVTLQERPRVAPRRRAVQRQFASATPPEGPVIPLIFPPIFNIHAP